MMRRWLMSKRIPYWPLGAYILAYVEHLIGYRFDDIAPSNTIRVVTCPMLLAHGAEDEMVPISEAQQIYAKRRTDLVRLLLMPGSHDEYGDIERHIEMLVAFLDCAVGMRDAFNQRNGWPEMGKIE